MIVLHWHFPFFSYMSILIPESHSYCSLKKDNFFNLFLAALGLYCFVQTSSSCGRQGLLCCGVRASYCGGFLLWNTALGHAGFSSCGT